MLRSGFQNILEAERAFFVTTRRQHHNDITTAIHDTALSSNVINLAILIVHLIVFQGSPFDTLIRQRFIPPTETSSAVALAKSIRSTQVHTIA